MPTMPLFDMRRFSRNNTAASKERRGEQSQAPPVPSSPIISTIPRQPLLPQTNLSLNTSQASLLSDNSPTGPSTKNSGQKRRMSRDVDSNSSKATSSSSRPSTSGSSREGATAHMPTAPSTSHRPTYANHPDLYTYNDLHSFSFGLPSNAATSSRSIDPLSPVRDDESEEGIYKADTTPRPSLVASSSPRSHSSQLSSMQSPEYVPASLPPPPRRSPAKVERIRTTSSSSRQTFGTSSASASASSLSSLAAMEFSEQSQRGDSSVTSEDDDEEHRHPIPLNSTPMADKLSLYGSDEDLDEDIVDDYEPDIEISSVMHDDPDRPPSFNNSANRSRESLQPAYSTRRGSLAVPIPSPNTGEGRDREDSIATLRRPSRSLEGLRSDSRAEGDALSRLADIRPPGSSPTSVPQSANDWRDIRRLSAQRGPFAGEGPPDLKLDAHANNAPSVSSSSTAVHNSALDGFDSSWNIDPATGIVGLEWDQSELQDIVGGFQGPPSSNRSFRRGSSSTTDSGRRLSTTSTNSDPFFKGLTKWGGQTYQDEKEKWTFKREKADRLEEHKVYERERNSITHIFQHKPSYTSASSSSISGFPDYSQYQKDLKTAAKEPVKREPQSWRGMALGAEEWWSSYTNGRYRVVRQNQPNNDPAKPFQQRLNVSNHRTPYSAKSYGSDGPTSTIHKHSKANGFSISRHYRVRKRPPTSHNGRASTSSRVPAAPNAEPEPQQRPSNMVLLAPRRVQEQYTSTNTTRMLESHGLLSEDGRRDPRDLERLEKVEREKKERLKREKEQEKHRAEKLRKAELARIKEKGKARNAQNSATDSGSSAGSITSEPQCEPGPSAGPSYSARLSVDHSILTQETDSSDRTVVSNALHRRVDNSPIYDFDDDDDDFDDYDGSARRRRPPSRTPHAEVFSPLPPEALESFVHNDSHTRRLFPWSQSKSSSALGRPLENVYKPQWPVANPSRHQSEKKGKALDTLNSSFQDVGLLPAVDEVRGSHRSSKRKHQGSKNGKGGSQESTNVFHSFSSDYLYMLLPLWPGETDSMSAKSQPYPTPNIPIESRKYLLIYYCPDPSDNNRGGGLGDSKKQRPRPSPTSSRDSSARQHDKHILLDKFHFCARIVSYSDIQGSGVRSPDMGLSVLGPLQEAVETMPTHCYIDTFQVIGMCTSREKGVEFVPEGLEKLGLARRIPDPQMAPDDHDPRAKRFSITGVEEADEVSDTLLILTPIGRAVVDMAWLGAMALTSFAPPN